MGRYTTKKPAKKSDRGFETKRRVSEVMDLPPDVLLDLPTMTYDGYKTLHCDNHKGIIEYTQLCVRFRTIRGEVRVCGKSLELSKFCEERLVISGEIRSIELL